MRASAFFKDELEERGIFVDMTNADSINNVKVNAKDLRDASKSPSFAMQYGCAAPKLQKMLKCTIQKAQGIFAAYHNLYKGLGEFAERNIQFAKKNGYIELAFGLKLRTPRINSSDGGIASAEGRSASNAKTQSWGQLMNRAFIEFDDRIEASIELDNIKLINTIHDAVYMLIRKEAKSIQWVNENLIECMLWQEDPMLVSDVKMGAELDIGLDWAHPITLQNHMTLEEIQVVLDSLKE